jgi:transcriptional regulator with XRE-family HTH domain
VPRRSEPLLDLSRIIGDAIRSARIAAGWTQRELAIRLGTYHVAVVRIEAGPRSATDLRLASAAFELLGIRMTVDSATLGLVGRREQRDFVHARCASHVNGHLASDRWDVRLEVEVGSGRYRGWIDVLAFRPNDRALLCLEIKTQLDDIGRIQRTLGWYQREAWAAASTLGWRPRTASAALLVLSTTENDARIRANRDLLREAFPTRAADLADWVRTPTEGALPPGLAMIDPRSRRIEWLRPAASDGRRSPAPYADYRAAAQAIKRA